jgi:hypothetical protein
VVDCQLLCNLAPSGLLSAKAANQLGGTVKLLLTQVNFLF